MRSGGGFVPAAVSMPRAAELDILVHVADGPMEARSSIALLVSSVGLTDSIKNCLSASPIAANYPANEPLAAETPSNMLGISNG